MAKNPGKLDAFDPKLLAAARLVAKKLAPGAHDKIGVTTTCINHIEFVLTDTGWQPTGNPC